MPTPYPMPFALQQQVDHVFIRSSFRICATTSCKWREAVAWEGKADAQSTLSSIPAPQRFFADDPLFQSGEALLDEVWSFIGTALAPDVVHWRFGVSRDRYLGGIRNAFQRLWIRGVALDRGSNHIKRWELVDELSEDALVQITERPSLGGDPILASAIAEAWLRASRHHGRTKMEPIMRQAILRVRVWNETRSLADLPREDLDIVLDCAFNVTQESEHTKLGASDSPGFSSRSEISVEQSSDQREIDESLIRAAKRIHAEAQERGWISPKSSKALNGIKKREQRANVS